MNKKQLLSMRKLKATPSMLSIAQQDTPVEQRFGYGESVCKYRYKRYLRAIIERDILKVAIFLPEHLRAGGSIPAYEVFLDKKNQQFITYDCIAQKWRNAKLDMLSWPQYVHYSTGDWISERTYMQIKRYLETRQGGLAGIYEFQLQVRAEELKQRHRRETDPWDMELSQTKPLPKDWERWVRKVGITANYIFYQYRKGGAKIGYCSYCEKEVPIKKPKHNKYGVCSRCGHKIQFKAIGRMGSFSSEMEMMYLMQRCDTGFMVRMFEGCRRYYRGDYKNPHYSCWEIRRAFYDKSAKPVSAYYWDVYKQEHARWIKGSCYTPSNADYYYNPNRNCGYVYGKSLPTLFKRELRYTGFEEYLRQRKSVFPEKYLNIVKKVPQLEQMLKANLPVLVNECLRYSSNYQDFFGDTKETSLVKAMGIDNAMLKELREINGNLDYLKWLRCDKRAASRTDRAILWWFCQRTLSPESFRFVEGKMTPAQIYRYIQKQMQNSCDSYSQVFNTWQDYIRMAKRLQLDTDEETIYSPRDLHKKHQDLVALINAQAMDRRCKEWEAKYPNISQIYDLIRPIYEYRGSKYMVVVPKGIGDILEEGVRLDHCVGTQDRYLERIEKQESYILFLRRTRNPGKAYYTLEVEPGGSVRQKRTLHDMQKSDIKKALEFLKEWQMVVTQRLNEEQQQLAQRSKVLREREFVDLREGNVIVRAGMFKGQLLVNLLQEDLMENAHLADVPVLAAAA